MKKLILIFCLIITWSGSDAKAQQDNIWTLEECISRAFEQNIQVRQNKLSNQRLELYAGQAKAQQLPSVNGSIAQNFNWVKSEATGESGLSGSNNTSYSVNSGVTIFNAWAATLLNRPNLILRRNYSLETTKKTGSIFNACPDLICLRTKNSESRLNRLSQLNLPRTTCNASISQSGVVKSQPSSERLTLANAESWLTIAKVNSCVDGAAVTADFEIAQPGLSQSINQNRVPDVKSVYETALGIKPQVKNAEVSKEIAVLDEKIAKAGYYPVLSASAGLSTGYNFTGSLTENDPYFDQLNDGIRPSLGFTLSIPVYQRKQIKTSVAVAKIGYEDALLNETDTKNELRKNIEQACQDVTSAQIEYEASIENYKATLESTDLSDEKFRQGMINSVEYLVSKTNLIVAESQLLQSKYNLIFSYKVLDFYTGIPLTI
jgi:outer membrane protein